METQMRELQQSIGMSAMGLYDCLTEESKEDPSVVCLAFEVCGDASRLVSSPAIPRHTRQWCCSLLERHVAGALDILAREAARWTLPTPGGELEGAAAFDLIRRDQAGSALFTAAKWALKHGRTPADVTDWEACRRLLRSYDLRLGRLVKPAEVLAILGERAALQGKDGWAKRLAQDTLTEKSVDSLFSPW